MGSRVARVALWSLCVLGIVASSRAGRAHADGTTQEAARARAPLVTPTEGPSTLHHLGLTIERSSMGWTGQWAPAPSAVPPEPASLSHSESLIAPIVLDGADLYRVSCRACHKADGSGSPPEIHSLIGPVQSASVEWMTERMQAAGRSVEPAFIRQLTSETEADLRKRFKAGGHNMPAFGHLTDAEIEVLRPYLDELAKVPRERPKRRITEPPLRVGELIVKGTCHICHDATGPGGNPSAFFTGAIPSLASIPLQKTIYQFVEKVRQGTPIKLGATEVPSRGRMPVFSYFTDREAASAYLYLVAYPPR